MPEINTTSSDSITASKHITNKIMELRDWRGKTLARIGELIGETDPRIVEEWKWDTPAWAQNGMICTGEVYKNAVKVTFAKGSALSDPERLFNSSLEGKVRRAIDFHEGEEINETALKNLIRAAVDLNLKGKN